MAAITALSGSGPAYYFFLTEALVEAGILLGLPRPLAEEPVTANAVGAAEMARQPGADSVRMRAAVTSPGGATIAAIGQFEERGVRAAVMAAAEAARDRADAMGRQGFTEPAGAAVPGGRGRCAGSRGGPSSARRPRDPGAPARPAGSRRSARPRALRARDR